GNLIAYLREQKAATGHVPDDRTIVVERFHDELGDWRVVIHSPFGAQVHAPWALAIGARLQERFGLDAQVMHGDDGIVLRLPENDWETSWAQDDTVGGADLRPSAETVFDDCARFPADEIEQAVTDQVGGSALFAARFRECAGRALLLPRRRPGQRVPLWQQRQRASQLLAVASKFASFPIVLETVRECLQDVFDVPGLVELLRDIEARRVRVVQVETPAPSPFAKSLLFGYVAQFMYEGDSPLAERRAAALSVDPSLLAELLGQPELRDLFDAEALADLEAELQHLSPDRHARDLEDAADLLRLLGPLTMDQALARGIEPAWLTMLERSRRVIRVRIAGEERWAAIEDAGRLRDGLGCPLPVGVPEAFTEPVPDPLGDLIARYARTHAPFTAHQVAAHFGLGVAVCTGVLERLAAERRVVRGAFRPDGSGEEWCDARVLRRLRRRTVAALRKQAEPVPPVALARLLPIWQSVGPADGSGPGRHARGADTGGDGVGDGEPWAPDWRVGTVTDPDYGSMRMGRTADWRTGGAMSAAAGRRAGGAFGAGQGMAGSGGGSARRTPDRRMRGVDGVLRAVEQLAGVPVPASALERLILPSRVSDYQPAMLDELTSSGEVVWAGAGALAVDDGWIALAPAAIAPLILPEPVAPIDLTSEPYRSILAALDGDAALFFRALASQVSGGEGGTRGRPRRDGRDASGTHQGAAGGGPADRVRRDGRDASGT
ncbi:MAG TPA: hypothetical protein VKV34_06965, partial [Thermoleophilia bacterium]|nr:hypothetical protein [Thermoleophilia bacterium]